MKKIFFMLLATISLMACDNGGDTPKPIELTGGTTNSQTVYADDTQKPNAIKFNATAPWTATVKEVPMNKAGESDVPWLTLNVYEGKAGEQSITLTILPNTTGADRKAEIRITCAGTTITITVEQKATNKNEEEPGVSIFINANGKIKGGEIFGRDIPTLLKWTIISSTDGDNDSFSKTPYQYANKNFDITLPTPSPIQLANLTLAGTLTLTPSDVKYATGKVITSTEGDIELTNIAWENANNDDYRVKKGEGYVEFYYFSKDAVINGSATTNMSENPNAPAVITLVYDNCKFRAGWNEMVMIATQDETSTGSITYNVTTNNAPPAFKWVAMHRDPVVGYFGPVTKVDFYEVITPLTGGSPSTEKYSINLTYKDINQSGCPVSNIGGFNIGYQDDKITFIGGGDNITANLNRDGLIVSHSRGILGYPGIYEYEYAFALNQGGYVLSKMTCTSSYDGKMSKEIYDITYEPKPTIIIAGGNYTKIVRSHYVDDNKDGVCDKTELIEQEIHDIEYDLKVSNHSWPDISAFCFSATNSFTFTQLFNFTYVSNGYGKASSNLPSKITNTVTSYTQNKAYAVLKSTYLFEYAQSQDRVAKVNVTGVRWQISLDPEVRDKKQFNSHCTLDFSYGKPE